MTFDVILFEINMQAIHPQLLLRLWNHLVWTISGLEEYHFSQSGILEFFPNFKKLWMVVIYKTRAGKSKQRFHFQELDPGTNTVCVL